MTKVKVLLDGGCDVNAKDYDKRTCLHLAASVGNMLVVQALQRHGANLSVRDRWGNTPLSESIREGHLEVVRYLQEAKVDLEAEATVVEATEGATAAAVRAVVARAVVRAAVARVVAETAI